MAKKLANKTSKELLSEPEIKEKGMNKKDFSASWNGRINILNPEKSLIAEKTSMTKEGEYAIKVR
tara:strand:+ start:136 stop:330 length:195 start_codon:yes stop_codon:yes gene_type:complete